MASATPVAIRGAASAAPATALIDRPALAFALAAVALAATAGSLGLLEPTETRYAEIARELRAGGDWLIPRLDGIAHLHKPPFAYWAAALGMTAFGENSWGARLPVAAASACTLAFTWNAVRRRFAGLSVSASLALWMLATMAAPFVLGRALATDPFLTAATTGYWAFAPSPAAIALLGLGFLIKGPVVFVPTLMPVLACAAWERSRAPLELLGSAWSWAGFAAIGLPWFVLAEMRVPGLFAYLVGNQIWERFAAHVHHREGPAWYFVAVLAAGSLPWSAALAAGVVRAWRRREREESRLLLAWLFVPIAFYSFSGSKLPAYILPCFPAAAALAALGLQPVGRGVRWATGIGIGLLAVAAVVAGPRLLSAGHAGRVGPLPPLVGVGLALWVAAAGFVIRARTAWAALALLAGWIAMPFGLARYEGPLGSPRPLATLLEENRTPGEPVVEYRHFNAGLPFYLRQPVRLLDVERELFFAPQQARAAVFLTADSLAPMVARHGRVWVLAPGRTAASLADSLGLVYRPTAAWRRHTLGFLEAVSR